MTPAGGRAIDRDGVRRILVHATNWIGDVVMTSPALRALREAYPEAEITLLARGALADALGASRHCDAVLRYDRRGRHRPPLGSLRLARALRARRFDLAVLFPKSLEAALLAWLAGIPRRAGWRTDGRGPLITHGRRMNAADRARHQAWQFFEPALFAGAAAPGPDELRVEFHLDEEDRREAERILSEAGLRDGAFLLALHPGTSKPPRGWHADRFAAAADGILRERDGTVLLLGGPGEHALCAAVRAACRARCLEPRGTTIRVMAALIERADLLLGNDSGPMHLAAAVGTPVVAVFGPSSPRATGPVTGPDLHRAVSLAFPCSPCRQDFFRECVPGPRGKPWCLEGIEVDRVVAAAEELLPRGRGVDS